MMPDYPDTFIKGIPHSDFIQDDGIVRPDLFLFSDRDVREDGWIEQSINWHDDDRAVNFTLNQVKPNGEIHFKAGVALILTEEFERLKRRTTYKGKIDYERDVINGNPYHGNLLVKKNLTTKQTRNALSAYLAVNVSQIVPR